MANLTENPIYEPGIFQLEKTTPPLGGAPAFNGPNPSAGHANVQALQLANRTAYLKEQLDTNLSQVYSYAELRAYSGPASTIKVIDSFRTGRFRKLATDPTGYTDDSGITIIATNGWVWQRINAEEVFVDWFLPQAWEEGLTNDSPYFQKAVNARRSNGGGTVKFSRRHLIDTNLFVEDYVSLVGGIDLPDEVLDGVRNYDEKRSLLIVNPAATITVRSGSSVSRCLVLRKGLDLPFTDAAAASAGVAAFSGTAFTVGGAGAYFHHLLIMGFNKAIYSFNCERVRCEYVQGDCTNGIEVGSAFDVCYVENCHFWPFTTTHQSWTTGELNKRSGTAYKYADVGDWSKFTNCFSYAYERGYVVDSCDNVSIVGCGADNYGPSINTTSIAFEIKGTSKDTLLTACQAAAQWRGVSLDISSTISANIKITSCSFWDNDDIDIYLSKGFATIDSCTFRNTPVGVYAETSCDGASVQGCIFDSNASTPLSGPSRYKISEINNKFINTDEDDTPLISNRIFIFADQSLPIFAKNLFENKSDKDGYVLTLSSLGDEESATSVVEEFSDCLMLDGSKVNRGTNRNFLTVRKRYHDVNQRERKALTITRVTPTCTATGSAIYSILGDSNINRQFSASVDAKLRARGFNPQFIGTMNGMGLSDTSVNGVAGPLGEGREGWRTSHFTNRDSSFAPVPVGGESAYMSLTKAQKVSINPFIKADSGPDSFNGYVFDYKFYLTRFGLSTPNSVGIGLGGNNILEAGTPSEIADRYINDLDIMVRSIRAAGADIEICLFLRGVSKTEDQDGKWIKHRELQKRLISYKNSSSDTKLHLISSWAHMSQEAGWQVNGPTDDYGVTHGVIGDNVHPQLGRENRYLYAESFAPFAAWVTYKKGNGFLDQGIPTQHSGKTAGVYELLGINTVPLVQQTGLVGYEAAHAISRISDGTSGSYLLLGKSRGTEVARTPPVNGDTLGTIFSAGYIDDMYQSGSGIGFYVDGTLSPGNRTPSAIRLSVVNSSFNRIDALRARADGSIEAGSDNARSNGTASFRWATTYSTQFRPGTGSSIWTSGTGTPEGSVTAPVGSMYTRTDGGAGTTLYVKESGNGNTGWVPK